MAVCSLEVERRAVDLNQVLIDPHLATREAIEQLIVRRADLLTKLNSVELHAKKNPEHNTVSH